MRLRVAGIPLSVRFLREFRYRGAVIGNRLISGLLLVRMYQIQAHTLQPAMLELQRLSSTVRQVDDATRNNGSAVIDADDYGFPVPQIRHLHIAPHGKREVCGSHIVHIVRFAASRRFAFENLSIPGRSPHLVRFGFADLFADLGSCLNRTNWSRCRLRDVRSLSRSQADDQRSNRQSMSYISSHSVPLAYSKVPLAVRLVFRCSL